MYGLDCCNFTHIANLADITSFCVSFYMYEQRTKYSTAYPCSLCISSGYREGTLVKTHTVFLTHWLQKQNLKGGGGARLGQQNSNL